MTFRLWRCFLLYVTFKILWHATLGGWIAFQVPPHANIKRAKYGFTQCGMKMSGFKWLHAFKYNNRIFWSMLPDFYKFHSYYYQSENYQFSSLSFHQTECESFKIIAERESESATKIHVFSEILLKPLSFVLTFSSKLIFPTSVAWYCITSIKD